MEAEMKEAETRQFTPEELASFVIVFRKANGWTQETLAEISGLNVRTIQRIERAEPSSLDARRALARAFQIEDIDLFNKPHTFKSEEQIRKEAGEFQRKNVTLDVSIATTGKQLADLAEQMNCHVFHQPDGVPADVAETAATIFDYLRDYGDVDEHYSFSQKLGVHAELGDYLATLNKAGFSVCFALRNTKLVGQNWADKTPWPVTIGYVFVAPSGREPKQIAVLKAIQLGF